MPELYRWKVQAAVLARLNNPDPDFNPVAFVEQTIDALAVAGGFDVQIIGDTAARRYYDAGDNIVWDRSAGDGTGTRPEYGIVVVQGGQYMVQFADGVQVPLPARDQP